MPAWDPLFATRSPMFEPLRGVTAQFSGTAWPTPAVLNRLAASRGVVSGGGRRLCFDAVCDAAAPAAVDYELRICDTGIVPIRDADWHDFFNACAWLTFAQTKAAINRAHAAELHLRAHRPAGQRGARRDALTLLDESGVLVLSSDAGVREGLRGFAWREVFWEGRERLLRSTRFLLLGHGLYQKALVPYRGMTGHALLLDAPEGFSQAQPAQLLALADSLAAQAVAQGVVQPRELSPLPVLGVPGWWPANREASFYEDTAYFRPGRGAGAA